MANLSLVALPRAVLCQGRVIVEFACQVGKHQFLFNLFERKSFFVALRDATARRFASPTTVIEGHDGDGVAWHS